MSKKRLGRWVCLLGLASVMTLPLGAPVTRAQEPSKPSDPTKHFLKVGQSYSFVYEVSSRGVGSSVWGEVLMIRDDTWVRAQLSGPRSMANKNVWLNLDKVLFITELPAKEEK